ncbi:hypothetical protein E0L36_04905 [Streptomyces sp. AJS327]|uniref:hypothetical protein n=1 Tax=Streptomyces sp. AJS327 TaxID=2545265 RepID=UPI0015DDDDF5|nr:hypothetical protein [Streptomyces sp. AJS327]MBA0050260.1 hypothetical protein [Streptomyces sp. AJS327]
MSTDHSPDAPEEEPRRRHGRRLTVVSVAAAVLLAGGGTYWAATGFGGSDSAPSGDQAEPPPLSLDSAALAPASAGEKRGPDPYQAKGELPRGPGSFAVHHPQQRLSKDGVAKLAKALGLRGEPRRDGERWEVAGEDDGPRLTVSDSRWALSRAGDGNAQACAQPLPRPKQDSATSDSTARDAPGPAETGLRASDERAKRLQEERECPDPSAGRGDPVSAGEAKKAVKPLLKRLGMTDARLSTESSMGSLRVVSVIPKVDGVLTHGWNSIFLVDEKGKLSRANGPLVGVSKGAEYPVVSAATALKQLNATRQQPQERIACATVAPKAERDGDRASGAGRSAGSAKPCGPARSGDRGRVTDATFGLASHYSNGKPVLVPSWFFEVKRAGSGPSSQVTHPAVERKYLKRGETAQAPGAPPVDGDPRPGTPAKPDSPTERPGSPGERPADPGRGGGIGAGGGAAAPQAVEAYSVKGRTLSVWFWAGVCDKYEAKATETGKRVEVRVEPRKAQGSKVCVKMAKRRSVEVELDKPLGERTVVDARDGDTLPKDEKVK